MVPHPADADIPGLDVTWRVIGWSMAVFWLLVPIRGTRLTLRYCVVAGAVAEPGLVGEHVEE
jgi:hypothetical protein